MRRHRPRFAPRQLALGAAAVALLGACSQRPESASTTPLDAALSSDLALAGQAQQRTPQVVSPQELTPAREPAPVRTRVIERERVVYRSAPATYATAAPAPAPTYDPYPAPRRDDPYGTYGTYDRGGSDRGGYGRGGSGDGSSGTGTYGRSSGPVYRPPQGHAQRDGAVGAVAGAAIGVAASHRKDRLRGGLLGAVAGGALGALYGHTVDRSP